VKIVNEWSSPGYIYIKKIYINIYKKNLYININIYIKIYKCIYIDFFFFFFYFLYIISGDPRVAAIDCFYFFKKIF
jgi:hypothetical protein